MSKPFSTLALSSIAMMLTTAAKHEGHSYHELLAALSFKERIDALDALELGSFASNTKSLRALVKANRERRMQQLRNSVSAYNMLAMEYGQLVITTGVDEKSSCGRIMKRLRAVHVLEDKLLAKIRSGLTPDPVYIATFAPTAAAKPEVRAMSMLEIASRTGIMPEPKQSTSATTGTSKNAQKKRAKKARKAEEKRLQEHAARLAAELAKPADPFAHLSDEDAATARQWLAEGCTVHEILSLFDELRPVAAE